MNAGAPDEVLDVAGIRVGVAAKGAAVGVGVEGVQHAGGADVVPPARVAAGGHRAEADAVVGVAQAHDVLVAAVSSGHEQREVVGLAARVDKVRHLCVRRIFRDTGNIVVGCCCGIRWEAAALYWEALPSSHRTMIYMPRHCNLPRWEVSE